MSWLLDTNIISELMRPNPDPNVVAWLTAHQHDESYLSVITIGEIRYGIDRLPPSKRRTTFSNWLQRDVLERYDKRILPIDETTMRHWSQLKVQLEQDGRPMQVMDSLLAATALQHGLTLVTRNIPDFQYTTLPLLNPWDA